MPVRLNDFERACQENRFCCSGALRVLKVDKYDAAWPPDILQQPDRLRGQFEVPPRYTAQFKKPDQSLFNQIVWTRCAGSDPNDRRAVWKPKVRNDLAFLVQIVMLDLGAGHQSRRVEYKVSGQFFFAHLSQMRCVRAIVTTHN